jgi:hypothetical protein
VCLQADIRSHYRTIEVRRSNQFIGAESTGQRGGMSEGRKDDIHFNHLCSRPSGQQPTVARFAAVSLLPTSASGQPTTMNRKCSGMNYEHGLEE